MIAFGGIVVVGMEQKDAGRAVAEAFDRGVNYFDVAPSYFDGEAEMKLGPALAPYRAKSFLACKTTERGAAGAHKELEQSLSRLKTDHFDLYQFHAVSSVADVDQILAAGGAAETFVKAREEGKVRFLGASVHNAEAAIALMDRFPLDSVMLPLNFVLVHEGNFGPQILAKAKEKGVARIALKSMAHTTWPNREHDAWRKCWYRPIDDPELAEKAVRFTLSEDITAAIPPGEIELFRMALNFAGGFRPAGAQGTRGVVREGARRPAVVPRVNGRAFAPFSRFGRSPYPAARPASRFSWRCARSLWRNGAPGLDRSRR